MATKKVKVPAAFNAKPVTKIGGGSAGVRDPRKPYVDKPKNTRAERPARWDAKTNIEKLREAAKTKPNSPAPRSKPAQKALPPGNKGGPLAKVPKALPAGNSPKALPAGKVGGKLANPGGNVKGGLAQAAIYSALQPVSTAAGQYLGTKLGEGLRPVGRRIDDLLPGVNSKDEAKRLKAKTPLRTMTAAERAKAVRLPQATGNESKPKPSLKATASSPSYRASSQGSSGSSMSRSTPKPPAKAQPGQSKDMNENYRAWAKANPALAAKVKSNQSGYNAIGKDAVAGVGPVKDGSSYKPQAEKTSEMNASAVRRAALSASAGSVTDSGSSDAPKEKPRSTASNFRTDIALLDKKKKK
jgi:hypothetical protein